MRCRYRGVQIFGQHGSYKVEVKTAAYDPDAITPWFKRPAGITQRRFGTLREACNFIETFTEESDA